ncbi:OmpA family protein [Arenibacter algicola]|mgnify:FL=1|jgi:outer membrane protein OmpA-like peptidoglycan-associated protein|uniref:OmpA family protein n=1 Tax=Arenibacter algicola TaxID=616991 RepID=A0A221URP4_9FLAO|nr:OmpA family protein [Arenibacter algicola]ASO03982.1 putative lipoprotein YiaD [Arenibacter algicola]|tara:strand:- start:2532 stop:3863 length:1332 start_codon:yes stop_codon:yes gene_type:complete
MNPFKIFPRAIPAFLLLFFFSTALQGQILKKLGKRAERAVERTVENRVDREASKKTDEVLDSILEPGSKGPSTNPQVENPLPPAGQENPGGSIGNSKDMPSTGGVKTIEVYSKFDYVPGDKPLFYDDFSNEFIGDFPSKWNTNGGGEVVSINDSGEKWLELISGYNIYFIPDVPNLPEEYTIEFDVMALGLDNKTSSTAFLRVALSDDDKFKDGANFVHAHIPFCLYSPIGITMANHINNKREIYSVVKADLRDEIVDRPHISIAVNKQRFRLWVNEEKHIDIPRMVPQGAILKSLKFHMNNFKDGKERIFISNLKVAEGGVDLRRKLISEGEVSTNGILFDSGSANIQPQSMGIIRQISQVLQEENGMNLMIIGHTDADGPEDTNLSLSQKRAAAVKNALVSVYGISDSRLQTQGKGENEPIGDNNTPDGKAQNRRVVFKKI